LFVSYVQNSKAIDTVRPFSFLFNPKLLNLSELQKALPEITDCKKNKQT
jgi:hypothetical protein